MSLKCQLRALYKENTIDNLGRHLETTSFQSLIKGTFGFPCQVSRRVNDYVRSTSKPLFNCCFSPLLGQRLGKSRVFVGEFPVAAPTGDSPTSQQLHVIKSASCSRGVQVGLESPPPPGGRSSHRTMETPRPLLQRRRRCPKHMALRCLGLEATRVTAVQSVGRI